MQKIQKIEGLVAAPFAPMDKNGNLNLDLVPVYYEFLKKNSVAGAFINGTTGEGPSLSRKEKHLQTEKWADCFKSDGIVRIINLVGGTSYQECIESSIHSKEAGISAVAVIAPYFFRPADENYLAEFVARVGESVPEMPVYFYHIPSMTGVNIPMIGFLKKVSGMIPNFAGIKYTHEDFMDFLSCLNFMKGKYQMFWGRDECMLSAMILGTKAFIGSTYNFAAPLYHKITEAFERNDHTEARNLQQLSVNMISLLGKYGGIATGKAFMRYIGIDCGMYRSPVRNMTEDMFPEFVKDVKSLNMDSLFSRR